FNSWNLNCSIRKATTAAGRSSFQAGPLGSRRGPTRLPALAVVRRGSRLANSEAYPRVSRSRASRARLRRYLSTVRSDKSWPSPHCPLGSRFSQVGHGAQPVVAKGFVERRVPLGSLALTVSSHEPSVAVSTLQPETRAALGRVQRSLDTALSAPW